MRTCLVACLAVLSLLWLAAPIQSATHNPANSSFAFTRNMGQWPDSILFRASAGGTIMWVTTDGIYYQFTKRIPRLQSGEAALAAGLGPRAIDPAERFREAPDSIETTLVKASFVGANKADVVGSEELSYTCNYFLGNDPSKWHTDVPNYAALTMREIYPGVDATFRGKNGKLEYVLSGPVETIQKIQTAYSGATAISNSDGSIVLSTPLGEKRFHGIVPASSSDVAPVAVNAANAANAAGNLTLVYSTYLGGNLASAPGRVTDDGAQGIIVDGQGSAYITGETYCTNFPTQAPYQADPGDSALDVFVTKLSPDGTTLVYSTYLGGNGADSGEDIAVDGSGCAYVTGWTSSGNFPTQDPLQAFQAGDAFVTKLSAAGNSLVYSTYLGGSNNEFAKGIAVDGSGCAYVTGTTHSADFPIQTPYQTYQGASSHGDAFVTKLSASGSSLVYSTYLGGSDYEYGNDIALDGSGSAYVIGETGSGDFPTQTPYQSNPGAGLGDIFVTKLSPAGNSLAYSTYLGGSYQDMGYAIAVDGLGSAYLTGQTISPNFPTQNAYQAIPGATGSNAFVTKLSPAGNTLAYSTHLAGSGGSLACGVAVDSTGCAYVVGYTGSLNFPTQFPYQTDPGDGASDVFVTKFSPGGGSLVYSTYLGGSSQDRGIAIALDGSGNAYVTGETYSSDFPTQTPYQTEPGDSEYYDVFVTKLSPLGVCCIGTTGNINETGIVDLADLSLLIAYLTSTPKPALPCPAEANVNATGIVDLGDLSLLIAYLTVTPKPTLPNCP